MSSEMIFPLLPVLVSSLPGGGPFALGVIEGIAESTSSFLKLLSGIWTDRIKRRTPFVMAGYSMASIVRPFIAFATTIPGVLALRFFDRIGKGLRSSPRDALIADSVPEERRGTAYGFQRIMDHTGAVAGPVIATLLMIVFGFTVRQVILFAAVPSAVVITILVTLREPEPGDVLSIQIPTLEHEVMSRNYRLLIAAIFVFTLGNSTDAFLLLRLSNAGVATEYVVLLWGLHHIMKIAGAWVGGHFSDRYGRKLLMYTGLGLYAFIYILFGVMATSSVLTGVFIVYGASIGILEPTERAWVSELSSGSKRGTAFGFYHAAKGLGMLPASLIFGFLWWQFSHLVAFLTGAGFAVAALGIIVLIKQHKNT